MKMTLSTSHAASLLIEDEYANWTYAGARALVEHLEELEDDCGESIEFDRVAIRCDFAQWASLMEWAEDYFSDWKEQINPEEDDGPEEIDDKIREYIRDCGHLIEFDGGIIVSSF